MAERNVPEDAIDWVLANYHTRRPAPLRPPAGLTDILLGDYNGRALKVYVVKGSAPPIVKTAVWEG